MPDETQNPGADAPAEDAAAPTTDAAVGEAAIGADVGDVGEDEFNPPNTMIVPTASGEEEVHVFSETGRDDAIIKPSGEIVRKVEGSGWDEYIDTQDVQGKAPVQNEAQEDQGINTQEQSTFETAPEQSVSSTETQWSVDQDQLLNPYEEEPSSIPKDQLLNPYEDEPNSIPKDELLNPYEDEPSAIPKDQLLNPYEDEEGPIPKDELLNPYEEEPNSIPEDQLLNPYEDDPVIDP